MVKNEHCRNGTRGWVDSPDSDGIERARWARPVHLHLDIQCILQGGSLFARDVRCGALSA